MMPNIYGYLNPHPPHGMVGALHPSSLALTLDTFPLAPHLQQTLSFGPQLPPASNVPSHSMNPATNDAPLDFNKKAVPTLSANKDEFTRGLEEKIDRANKVIGDDKSIENSRENDRIQRKESDDNITRPMSPSSPGSSEGTNQSSGSLGITSPGALPQWGSNGMNYNNMLNIMTDPSVMSMMNIGQLMLGLNGNVLPETGGLLGGMKKIVHCKDCTLFPPNPNAPPPTTRERPLGCRTVFVGGLPENISEEVIREVFEQCGEITTVRLSKKNFCHIRFECEAFVDSAIFLSGYRIRLGSSTDPLNTGRLHVDYAQARDDQYEYECRLRQLQREQRHRERLEQERLRPPSPPPVMHFTDHEAQTIAEKLKDDTNFSVAVQVLVTWLERGDCTKRNSGVFYSMIQSTNSHVRRLMAERSQYEEELQKARDLMRQRMQGILMQFSQIDRVLQSASHQKVWDHFTKAQRKNIEMWKKQAVEIKTIQLEEALNERAEEEMDVSDLEDEVGSSPKKRFRMDNEDNLKEENDSLRCQLEAYKNEVDLVRIDMKAEIEEKEAQNKLLQQTLQEMQMRLLDCKTKQSSEELQVQECHSKVSQSCTSEQTESVPGPKEISPDKATSDIEIDDARLIGLISTFLNVHPFGATLDCIVSYLSTIINSLKPSQVVHILEKYSVLFKQEAPGAEVEGRWLFAGFQTQHQ